MELSPEGQTTTAEVARAPRGHERSLVLVAGPGRSGTSLFTGILQRLGFHVPQPEIPADDTNPRGFAESQWVVEFHSDLLRVARVQMADARPAAWAHTAQLCLDDGVQRRLRRWLKQQFRQADDVVIKDPRLSWFLPLWRRCAEDISARPLVVTVLRHPAAVIDSKQRWYGAWQGEVARAAGWLNQMLFTERATRDDARAFVRYDDLLEDWTQVVARLGTTLDLAAIRDVPVPAVRRAHEFVDRALSRSKADWGDFRMPAPLREQVDDVWELVSQLADGDESDTSALAERLDDARRKYIELYEDAEAIAQSSIGAGRRRAASPAGFFSKRIARLAKRVPPRYRRKVPAGFRARVTRALGIGDTGRS